jgi:hypothetical protein
MKLLAFLVSIVSVLALGTAQQQVRIQTQNVEGVWGKTLSRPSSFLTSVNSQATNRLVTRGTEGVWQNPLSAPSKSSSQQANRILVRKAEGIWHSPLINVQSPPQVPALDATPSIQPTTPAALKPTPTATQGSTTTPLPKSTATPTPTLIPTPPSTSGDGQGGGGASVPRPGNRSVFAEPEVIAAIIGGVVAVITAYLGYLGVRAARRH